MSPINNKLHMHIPACIAVGVVFRVVVVARVVAQPAADARSRRTHSISCAHRSHAPHPCRVKGPGIGSLIASVWYLGSGIRERSVIRRSGIWGSGIWSKRSGRWSGIGGLGVEVWDLGPESCARGSGRGDKEIEGRWRGIRGSGN